MTHFVVESVLHNLIQNEFTPFSSFHKDLRKLADFFTTIKASLKYADQKQFSDTNVNNWLLKINNVAHMVDDIIDECAYEELRLEYQGVKGDLSIKVQRSCLSSFHLNHVVFGYKVAKKMKRISERLIEIVEENKRFHLTGTWTETVMNAGGRDEVIEERRTSVYKRIKDRNTLLRYLISGPLNFRDDLSVYTIEGAEGIGKRTFSKLIFNHQSVVNHFELRIWACSFLDFSLKGMIEAITKAAIGCDCEDLDLELLQKRLQYILQRKRYLIVLDFKFEHQSWHTFFDDWESLKSILACGKAGASILVTAPSRLRVAEIMGTRTRFVLSKLFDNDCWELFRQQVFEPYEERPFELETIGMEIIQKCQGEPFAAKLLGGLLHFSSREGEQWLDVNESNIWSLQYEEDFIEKPQSLRSALILSYLNLPIRLKKCFAYCAILPKGEIRKAYLIELWMANGFISSNAILDVEDVGNDVWNELYRRSFFQDIETDEFGNFTSFRMHDLVIDLAVLVAKDVKCLIGDNTLIYSSDVINHLSYYRRRIELDSIYFQQVKSLRTYPIPNQCSDQLFPKVLKCHSLRVLEFRLKGELSPSIGDLKHLRYLNLSKSDFKTLPECLCKLWNLQILKLDYCKHLQKLPNRQT